MPENDPENMHLVDMDAQIAALHPSLFHLVSDTELLLPVEDLAEVFSTKKPIYLASDGGASPRKGSYGWVLQVGDLPIARGKGAAQGSDPHSFRAEGYGMSSGLLYLLQIHLRYGIERQRGVRDKLICNNQGLLTRIERATAWKYMTPNVTLSAEWDLESVIVDIYQELGITFEFTHVKSHQDDDGPVDALTLEAQLNVQADALATEALKHAPTYNKVMLFPTAKCQLILDGVSITSKIPQAIRGRLKGNQKVSQSAQQVDRRNVRRDRLEGARRRTLPPSGTTVLSSEAMPSTPTNGANTTPKGRKIPGTVPGMRRA
jgi:hypothetical protein